MDNATTPAFRFNVIKGCAPLGIRKGEKNTATISRVVVGKDACLVFDTSSKIGNGRMLWLSGNRVNLPEIKAGLVINLNDGNPLHRVKIEVMS